MYRPDLVDVWVFRLDPDHLDPDHPVEILLMRRAPGRPLAGLWQGVSGSLEADERIVSGALRELREETGFDVDTLEAFYDLDLVNQFHWSPADAIVSSAVFAARVGAAAEPVLSDEHDTARWVSPTDARPLIVWPAYRDAIAVIERDLLDAGREAWFRLQPDGSRMVD